MENELMYTKSGWLRENTEMVILFIVSAVFVYFLPPAIARIYYAVLLLLAFRSNKPYFWIAFIFLLYNEPAGIFSGSTANDLQRVPFFSFGKGASITVFDIFLFGYAIKALIKPKQVIFFKSGATVLAAYAVVLFFFSLTLGMSPFSFVALGRLFVLPFLFFLLVPRLIRNRTEFESMIKLVLPFMILAIIGQVHEIYFGKYLTAYFKEGADTIASTGIAMSEAKEGVARVYDSEFLTLLSFIICGFFLILHPRNFNRLWLVSVMFMGFIICFSSATRGIFITFSLITINLFYFLSKSSLLRAKDVTSIVLVLVIALVGFNLLKQSEVLSTQLTNASDRLSSIGSYFGEKDTRSNETGNLRLEVRIPNLMKHIKESPILGFGFSDKANEYSDGHVGFHNQMLEGGVMELLVFLYFFVNVISKVRGLTSGFKFSNEKHGLRFYVYTLIAILVVHGTASQHFGYILGFQSSQRWFMFGLFFCGLNIYYAELKQKITNENIILMKAANNRFSL